VNGKGNACKLHGQQLHDNDRKLGLRGKGTSPDKKAGHRDEDEQVRKKNSG